MLPKKTKINTCTWNGALGIGFTSLLEVQLVPLGLKL